MIYYKVAKLNIVNIEIMRSTYYPIILGATVVSGSKTTFNLPEREVQITIPKKLSEKLIGVCDGTHNIAVVTQHLSKYWSQKSIKSLLKALVSNGAFLSA